MILPRDKETVKIDVDFYDVDCGWISFTIKANKQIFKSHFSEVFDPLIDLKHWLEAIAIGVKQTSFSLDPEGDVYKFYYERISYNKEFFKIYIDEVERKPIMIVVVKRKQLVRAFYKGYLSFVNSPKYIKHEWEGESVSDCLCKILNMNKKQIIDIALMLNMIEFEQILNFAETFNYLKDFEKMDLENWLINLVNSKINNEVITDELKSYSEISFNIVPEDYDTWEEKSKIKFIKECFEYKIGNYNGTKINKFRSKIIERYIRL